MEEIVFEANRREVIGKNVKKLRRNGLLPAVVYGHSIEPVSISLNYKEASKTLDSISPSALVVLDIDGEKHYTLVRDKQRNPVRRTIIHVDFQAVSLTETVRADVTVNLIGEAPAVETYLGILVPSLEQLSIECVPTNLPDRIDVDLSGLTEIGDSILVSDIIAPEGVEILNDPDEVVVVVIAQAAEEEEEEEELELELEEGVEPEMVERGKREEEEQEEGPTDQE
ncbi:MAG: 50S ribosomal protein L25 [Anaerolineales bacterium]|jgi:large subunit ribosomal protein L25